MSAAAQSPEDMLELFRETWDAGDADAFAQLFTEDATYVIFRGDVLLGRDQIRQAHRGLFAQWQQGPTLVYKVLKTTALDKNTCVVLTVGGIGTGELAYDKLQTCTLVRRDGRWLVAAFQNTEMSEQARQQYN